MAEPELGPILDYDPFKEDGPSSSLGPLVDDPFSPPNARAQQNVVTGSFGKPDQAAAAINLSQKTGTPASVIQLNPEQHKQNYDIQRASAAVDSNPAIAKFMQKPENAAVAVGATGEMDEVSKKYLELSQERLNNKPYDEFFKGMLQITPHGFLAETGEAAMSAIRNISRLSGRGELGVLGGMAATAQAALAVPELVLSPLTGAIRSFGGRTLQAIDELMRQGAVKLYGEGRVPAVPSFEKEASEAERLSMVAPMVGFAPRVKGGEALKAGYTSIDDFLHTLAGMQTRDEINAFLKKAAGGDEATPMLQIEKAKSASETLDAAVEASKDQPLREKSVAAYEEFLRNHEDVQGNVHIPGQALVDLYKGGVPAPGDKLLGFGITPAEFNEAARTGSEVAIPLSKYIANIADRPEVHDQLKDVLRVHEDGVTLEEADAIKEAQKAEAAAEENTVTGYHGSQDVIAEFDPDKTRLDRGVFFAQNPSVASSFAEGRATDSDPLVIYGEDTPATIEKFVREHTGDAEAERIGRMIEEAEAIPNKNESRDYDRLANAINDELRKVSSLSTEVGGGAPNVTRAKVNLGKTHKVDMGGKFSWDREREEIDHALKNGFDSVTFTNMGVEGDVYTVFDKNRIKTDPVDLHVPDKRSLSPEERIAVRAANAANRGLFLKPFFEEAKALGISEANFDRFSKQLDKAKELELTRAVAVARRELNKLTTPAYKRDEAAMRKQVEEELTNSPAFHADRFFNTDKGMLPNGTRVSKAAVEAMRAAPDEWAPHFGFESGKAMTDAINELASERKAEGKGPKWQLKKRVDDEVAKRMEATHGNLKDNIEIAASEIALENHNVDLLTTQLRMLAEANGLRPPIGREALEKMVRNEFAKLPTSGISAEKFRRAAEKAGTRTQTAFLKKDIVEAFNGVQQQRLALVFMREAKAFQKEMDKFNNNIVRLQQNRVLSGVEQRFTDQLHRLLDKMGYTNPRSEGELASALQNAPFKQFVEDHLATGAEMPVADFMLSDSWTADVGEMTVDNFRAVHESIESILHNGKMAKTIRVGQEKRDFVQTVAEAVNQVADVDPRVIAREPGLLDSLKGRLAEFDAMMLKMEQMLRWMDKRDKFGVFSQAAFRPLTAAKHLKNDLLKEIGKDIQALPKLKGAEDDVVMLYPDGTPKYPTIVDWQNGEPMTLKKKHVLMMALHSGNESNYGKLTSKYEYNNKTFQWDSRDIYQLTHDVLTKADWEHVQGWWNLFEKYWPRVEKLSRDMSGIAPDKIEAREITNKHGTWKGGYVPVGADSLWPGLKRVEKGVFNAERYFNAVPPKRYTIARTDASYPVSLAFDNLTNTLYQMAHDLAFREPLHDAAKFLDHPDVRGAIQRVLGPEYLRQVRPWLEFQAQSKRMGDDAVGALDKLAQTARQRIVTVQMLYRASTILKHGAAAAMYSIGEVGLKDMVAESVRLWMTADGRRRVGQILEESGELRHRLHDMDRDIGEMQDRALGESGFKASFFHLGGMGTAALDIGTAIPTYEVAFKNQLLKNPNDYQAAVYAGEAAVRDAHGSMGITDQSAIMRSSPMYKLFTIAYGTFNHNYNRTRDIGKLYKESGKDWWGGDTAAAWEKFKTASWRGLWYIFMTAMIEEAIAPIPDKEGKKHGILAWSGRALFDQLSGQLPVVRDVARAWLRRGRPEEQTPMGQIVSSIYDGAKAAAERDFTKKMALKKTMEAAGYLFNVPGAGQMGVTAQYWEDIKMRRQTAENPYRFMRGTLLGKSHPERK